MKRSELEIGKDYLVSRSSKWRSTTYDRTRVRVVDLGNWHKPPYSYTSRASQVITLDDGVEFHVAGIRAAQTTGRYRDPVNCFIGREVLENGTLKLPKAYPLTQVRTTWAEGRAEQEENERRRQESEQRQQAERSALVARRAEQEDRMKALGINVYRLGTGRQVDLTDDQFEQLLTLAERSRTVICDHDWPEQWDYQFNPAGSKTCRKCGATIHD